MTTRDRIDRKVLDITHRTVAANGITKPSQRKGQPKRGQRTTKQKAKKEIGRERGEAKAEILEKKIVGSLEKVKVVKDRRVSFFARLIPNPNQFLCRIFHYVDVC